MPSVPPGINRQINVELREDREDFILELVNLCYSSKSIRIEVFILCKI